MTALLPGDRWYSADEELVNGNADQHLLLAHLVGDHFEGTRPLVPSLTLASVQQRWWQLPWLRVSLLLRKILHGEWSREARRLIQPEIPKVLAQRSRIRREGWFN